MKRHIHSLPIAAIALCLFAGETAAQQVGTPPAADPAADIATAEGVPDQERQPPTVTEEEGQSVAALADRGKLMSSNKVENDGTILVTGSRLQTGDVTSRVQVIDQAEIRARGVTSVEQLIQTLPQNVATIGTFTNDRSKGPLGRNNNSATNTPSALGQLGVSAANLGGVGASNTLVLVNGRRLAGAAGFEGGFVNLNGIPLSAIDRVEISQGASAVYGADAIGGVINFILKQGYTGTTLTAQYENSSNAANNDRVSLYSGKSWGTGNFSVTVDYNRRSPIDNYKSGYTTEDYSAYYNDPTFDLRSFSRGLQPGVIDQTASIFNPVTFQAQRVVSGLTVPNGFTGVPRISDFVTVGREALRDYVPQFGGPRIESASASFGLEQKLFDRVVFFANGLYSRSKSRMQQFFDQGITLYLAPGQAYNPFPAQYFDGFSPYTTVSYFPGDEIAGSKIAPGQLINLARQWSVNTGLRYEFGTNSKLEVVYTTSRSTTRANSTQFASLVTGYVPDALAPNGYSCYNFQLANNRYPASQRAYLRSVFDQQCQVLSSPNPSIAFNPWKSVANGGGSSINAFRYIDSTEDRQSRLQNVEARLNGRLLALPAGGLYYVVGGEYNDDGVDSDEVRRFTGERVGRKRKAVFAEVTVPIFGNDYDLPLMRTLTFNLALRRDIYDTEGAIGTIGGVPIDQGGQVILGKNRFARNTPAFGVRWEPLHNLTLRARWTQGFAPPPYTQLFSVQGTQTARTIILNRNDPLYQCTTDCTFGTGAGRGYFIPRTSAPNPNLLPQTSRQQVFSAAWVPDGFLRGLNLAVTYNRNRIFNQYASVNQLASFLTIQQQYQLPQFYPRDANGKITAFNAMIFNITGSRYESVTYEASYRIPTGIGTFTPSFTMVDNLKAETQPFPNSKAFSTIGTLLGVDRYRIVGQLNWTREDWSANLFMYRTPSYTNDYIQQIIGGAVTNAAYLKPVDGLTTFDLTASWQARPNIRIDFAGRNILKAPPPFVVIDAKPYDTARYNPLGRTLSLQVQYSF